MRYMTGANRLREAPQSGVWRPLRVHRLNADSAPVAAAPECAIRLRFGSNAYESVNG